MPKTWFAIYTRSRNEKKVFQNLTDRGIEAYLPLIKTLRMWSDRRKWVHEPLFRSYLFVHIPAEQRLPVLEVYGVVKFVTFEGRAVPIPEPQIEAIKLYIDQETQPSVIPHSNDFSVDDKVLITAGPLRGLNGTIVRKSGKQTVKIEIEAVAQSIYISVPASLLKPI